MEWTVLEIFDNLFSCYVQCAVYSVFQKGKGGNFMQMRELEAPVNYEISCRSDNLKLMKMM